MEEKIKEVRLGNFKFTMNEADGIINVITTSHNWYIGYAPGTLMHAFLCKMVFTEEPDEEGLNAASIVIASIYAASSIIDSQFTDDLYKAINKYTKKENNGEETPDEDKELEDLQRKRELSEQISE